jgi:hypothetical protein
MQQAKPEDESPQPPGDRPAYAQERAGFLRDSEKRGLEEERTFEVQPGSPTPTSSPAIMPGQHQDVIFLYRRILPFVVCNRQRDRIQPGILISVGRMLYVRGIPIPELP